MKVIFLVFSKEKVYFAKYLFSGLNDGKEKIKITHGHSHV